MYRLTTTAVVLTVLNAILKSPDLSYRKIVFLTKTVTVIGSFLFLQVIH